jgi:hypothetical protein
MGNGIERPQHIEPLTPGGGIDKPAVETPQKTEKRLQDKMRCIDKVNVVKALPGIRQIRL